MRATWYVLEDESVVDPNECALDEAGRLVHGGGVAVKMRFPDCPMSTGVDVDEKPSHADMEPEPARLAKKKPGYKTRETKAD